MCFNDRVITRESAFEKLIIANDENLHPPLKCSDIIKCAHILLSTNALPMDTILEYLSLAMDKNLSVYRDIALNLAEWLP